MLLLKCDLHTMKFDNSVFLSNLHSYTTVTVNFGAFLSPRGTPGSHSQHKQPLIYFLSLFTVYMSYKGNFTESVFCLLSLDNVFEAYPCHSMSGFLFFIITESYSIIWIYSWPCISMGFMHPWIQPTMEWKKFFFFFLQVLMSFWLCHVACGILVRWPGPGSEKAKPSPLDC